MLTVMFTLVLGTTALGRALPFATHAPIPFAIDLTLFVGYLYFVGTLFRLPFALVITVRRARHAQQRYGLSRRESLRDGFARGFLDRRRWYVGQLAMLDRFALIAITLWATTPYLGVFLVKRGGLLGILLMLIVYLTTGTFSFLLSDTPDARTAALPFLDIER
jgi:hypothetical protein